jgi:hypothetical protein
MVASSVADECFQMWIAADSGCHCLTQRAAKTNPVLKLACSVSGLPHLAAPFHGKSRLPSLCCPAVA